MVRTFLSTVLGSIVALGLLLARTAPAQDFEVDPSTIPSGLGGTSFEVLGPNSDFPDSNLVMPWTAQGSRITFLSISNLGDSAEGDSPVPLKWAFYAASGELILDVERYTLGEGATDIVDVTAVGARGPDGTLGPTTNLGGQFGFVVVSQPEGLPDLIGNFTIADTEASSGFGGNASGLGYIGLLDFNAYLFGTSFAPSSLGDNLLIIVGVDDLGPVPTSLTDGAAPSPGETVFALTVSLHSSDAPEGILASVDIPVEGSAFASSIEDLFPGFDLDSSVTIAVTPITAGVSILGYYGQALAQFGAGQTLRTDIPLLQ